MCPENKVKFRDIHGDRLLYYVILLCPQVVLQTFKGISINKLSLLKKGLYVMMFLKIVINTVFF